MRIPRYWDAEPTSYGSQPFLVRVDSSRFNDGKTYLVVSDRKETFVGRFSFEEDPLGWTQLTLSLSDAIIECRTYLWAKYLGNLTLRLRVDPKPDQSLLAW